MTLGRFHVLGALVALGFLAGGDTLAQTQKDPQSTYEPRVPYDKQRKGLTTPTSGGSM